MSVEFLPGKNASQAQKLLADALLNKDIIDFEIALDMGADPLNLDDNDTCAYEIALSTYGHVDFVTVCLAYGCSPNYVNHRLSKAAINYAADSRDPQIINKLMAYSNIMVNHKFQNQTPLHKLISRVNRHNVDDVVSCMDILLSHGASPLICDGLEMTLLESVKENPNLNDRIKAKLIDLLALHTNGALGNSSKENEVVHDLKHFVMSIVDSDIQTFDTYFKKGLNYTDKYINKSPVEFALSCGNYYALKKLLHVASVELDTVKCPLVLLARNWKETSDNYHKCFYLLLKLNCIDINESDDFGSTALHYAVENHNDEAIRKLLKRGAYIGAKNHNNTMPIHGIGPELLRECFNNCVSSKGSGAKAQENFEISLNYENLMANTDIDPRKDQFIEELAAIRYIAESEKHRHLLVHPVVSSFLSLKWRQLSFIFYANFLLHVFFAISMTTYAILKVNGHQDESLTVHVFWVMSCVGIIYTIFKEFIQLLNERFNYFLSFSNYMELTMISMAIIICCPAQIDPTNQRILAVLTILVISVEMFLLAGSLPVYSLTIHMRMFEVVCKSFVKSLTLYSIFLITFGLCFHILFANGDIKGSTTDSFNKFSSPLGTMVKTMVMLTGEFDAGAMEFNTLCSYAVFLLFVFLMTIVLYNLLNGLAVSDIQAIRGRAEQSITNYRIKLIIRYGKGLPSHSKQLSFKVNLNRFRPLYRPFKNLYASSTQDIVIESIGKNADNGNLKSKTTFQIQDQRVIELAMDILEQKTKDASRHKCKLISENRLYSIDNKLKDVCNMLEGMKRQRETCENNKL